MPAITTRICDMKLDKARVLPIIKAALKEDVGRADITTQALVDKSLSSTATLIVKEDAVICGLEIAEWVMGQVDYSVRFRPAGKDGDFVGAGKELAFLEGRLGSILRAERVMLNFLTLLSGIATRTKEYADKVKPYGVRILDTRKTFPLLRYLEKYAVLTGGGHNHRMGLYDQVLIKDNHIAAARLQKMNIAKIIQEARHKNLKGTIVEIEVKDIQEFKDALAAKPDIIMLDNMKPADIATCIGIRSASRQKPVLEASGGINLDNIEEYAKTRVDTISIGALTHSVRSIDMSLEIM